LISANIPRTFYNIPENSSFIHNDGNDEYTITLEAGNYTITNIKVIVKEKLNDAGSNTYDVSFRTSTEVQDFKFTFSISNSPATQPQFIFNTSLFKVLGFDANSTNIFVNNELKSTNCINLSRINSAYIKSDICKNSHDSILSEILSYGIYSMLSIAYQTTENIELSSRNFVKQTGSQSYTFSLVDDEDKEINLNGIDYSFSIIIYTRDKTPDLQKKDLMIKNLERQFKIFTEQQQIKEETTQEPQESKLQPSTIEPPPEFYQQNKPLYNYISPLDITNVNQELI
jgi:hypothetical protein